MKINYIKNACDVLTDESAENLLKIAREIFVPCSSINYQQLLDNNLVTISGDCLCVSSDGMGVLLEASDSFEEDNPEALKKTRTATGVSDKMWGDADTFKTIIEEYTPVKSVSVDRSNVDLKLKKRYNGVRLFEIRHAGTIRIFGYKIEEQLLQKFIGVGADVKVNGSNSYIDLKTSKENMQLMINLVAGVK
jgi:hypothetical protein